MNQRTSIESQGSVHLPIDYLSAQLAKNPTLFEPQSSAETANSSNTTRTTRSNWANRAPEKKLTLFALRLAVLEKAATGLGTLGFIWATVVLLGGFAITIDKKDFWFITVILLIESARIFSRSHELEWQHQATWSLADAGVRVRVSSFRATRSSPRAVTRTWTSSDVPILPYGKWVFLSRNISRILYWLQLASATACVVLSVTRLVEHDFGERQLCCKTEENV